MARQWEATAVSAPERCTQMPGSGSDADHGSTVRGYSGECAWTVHWSGSDANHDRTVRGYSGECAWAMHWSGSDADHDRTMRGYSGVCAWAMHWSGSDADHDRTVSGYSGERASTVHSEVMTHGHCQAVTRTMVGQLLRCSDSTDTVASDLDVSSIK